MNVLISGVGGHMGQEVLKLARSNYRNAVPVAGVDAQADLSGYEFECAADFEAIGNTDNVDVIVDFSHHSLTKALTDFAVKRNIPLVLATTGQTDEEKEMVNEAAKSIPVFFAANFSMGVALLIELAKKAAAAMPDAEIEIVETHHDRKIDAPSGTALAIANAIKEVRPEATFNLGRSGMAKREPNEIGINAIRMGNVAGIHEVLIGTQNQTITLKHEAHSRALFAEGALAAAEYVIGKPAGLYKMESLI